MAQQDPFTWELSAVKNIFKRKLSPEDRHKQLEQLANRMRILAPVPPRFAEVLEVFSSFHFFYLSSLMASVIFVFQGKDYFGHPVRLSAMGVFLVVYYLMSRSLRNSLQPDPFELPEHHQDKLFTETITRLTSDGQPVRRIHTRVIEQYIDARFPEENDQ